MSSQSMVAAATQVIPHLTTANVTAGSKRPRSSTSDTLSNSRRTKSRASTLSIASSDTQHFQHHRPPSESSCVPPVQHALDRPYHYSPEEMITRSEQQLTNPNQSHPYHSSAYGPVDYAGSTHAHERSASQGQDGSNRPFSQGLSFKPYQSLDHRDDPGPEQSIREPVVDDSGTADGRRKKGSASSIANDIELKKLFRENVGRSLKDVAAQVLANERGPKAEKTKQIFAMLW
ncbi:MAG: hypothetical protein Q9220_007180 [cf. Caloplaca sp. 1 TL-2023]